MMSTSGTDQRKRRVVTFDVWGWDGIAQAMGVSVTTAREWAKRETDPLPAKMLGGRYGARLEDLEAWARRNEKPVS